MICACKDTYIAHARKSQCLLTIKMLRSFGEYQPFAAVSGGTPINTTLGNRNIQATKSVHDLRKDVHIGDYIMIHTQAKIQIQGTRQKTRSMFGAAVGVGCIELLTVRAQVKLNSWNMHPQVAREFQRCDALPPEIDANGTHHI